MDKKGAELTIGTLVVIVLAIIVLVVLALGFGTGWTNLWSKISGMFSPVNVDSVKQACVYACTTQAKYDWCNRVREIKYEKDQPKIKVTCESWSNNTLAPGETGTFPDKLRDMLEKCDNIDRCPEVKEESEASSIESTSQSSEKETEEQTPPSGGE